MYETTEKKHYLCVTKGNIVGRYMLQDNTKPAWHSDKRSTPERVKDAVDEMIEKLEKEGNRRVLWRLNCVRRINVSHIMVHLRRWGLYCHLSRRGWEMGEESNTDNSVHFTSSLGTFIVIHHIQGWLSPLNLTLTGTFWDSIKLALFFI